MMYSVTSQTWPQKTLTGYEGTLIPKVQIERQNYDSKADVDESHSKPRQVECLARNKILTAFMQCFNYNFYWYVTLLYQLSGIAMMRFLIILQNLNCADLLHLALITKECNFCSPQCDCSSK